MRQKEARYRMYRRLGGSQCRSARVRKISPPPGFDSRTVQPVASRYADWAIPAYSDGTVPFNKWISVFLYNVWMCPLSLPVPDSTIAVRTAHKASGFRHHFETILISFQYNTQMEGTVPYRTVLYCTVLYRTVPYCTILYYTVLYCTVLRCSALHKTVLYCTVLYCTVLYCTVLLPKII
jgi:hypothetical protein